MAAVGTVVYVCILVLHCSGECFKASTSQEGGSNIKQQVQSSASSNNSKVSEKKRSSSSTKQPSISSTQHKVGHAVDKTNNSSAIINPVDLQSSVFGRSNTALSAMTVPIRLDALSYLLNNALMGTYRMAPQVPFYGGQCALPMCQSSAPLYTNPIGHVSQNSCGAYGCCPVHPAAQMCPTAHMYPTPPQVCPGNMCTDPSQLPGRQAGSQKEPTILYPPVVQRDPNAAFCNPSGASSATNNTNVNESNKWNNKSSDTAVERQNPNFVQSRISFSGGSDGQSSSPKRCFGNSSSGNFGNWNDSQRGNSWSGRQQKDFDKPAGRFNDNFSSGSWRGNSRGQNRDSGFGGKSQNYDFGNRKRSQDEGPFSQDDGPNFKQGRWESGRGGGRGGGRGSWQQRSDNSSARAEHGNVGDRLKSIANSTSNFSQASFSKNDNANEDWDTDYKLGEQEQLSAVTSMGVSAVDKKQVNCTTAATTKNGLNSTFAAKVDSNDDWETDCNAEQSKKLASKAPSVLDQKSVMPHLSRDNTESMENSFETKANTTEDEDTKVSEGVDKNESVKDPSTHTKECNIVDSDMQENSEKSVFEKVMLSDIFPKSDDVTQSTLVELEEGELINASRHIDIGPNSLKSGESTEFVTVTCSSLPCAQISSSKNAIISKAVKLKESLYGSTGSQSSGTQGVNTCQSSVYLGVHPKKVFLNKSEVSDALITLTDIPASSSVSQAVDAQTECPNKYTLDEESQTVKELLCTASTIKELAMQKDILKASAVPNAIITQEDFTVKPYEPKAFQTRCIEKEAAVLEPFVTHKNFANKSVVTEAIMEGNVTKTSAVSIENIIEENINHALVSEGNSTEKRDAKEPAIFDDFGIKNHADKSDASVVDNAEKDITNEYVIPEDLEMKMDVKEVAITGADKNGTANESKPTQRIDTESTITERLSVSAIVATQNDKKKVDVSEADFHKEFNLPMGVADKSTVSEKCFSQQNIVSDEANATKYCTNQCAILEANNEHDNLINASAAPEEIAKKKDLTNTLAIPEGINKDDLLNTSAASKMDDTHKDITDTPTVLDLVSKAGNAEKESINSPAVPEGLDTYSTNSISQNKAENGIILVFAAESDSTKHIVMDITNDPSDK